MSNKTSQACRVIQRSLETLAGRADSRRRQCLSARQRDGLCSPWRLSPPACVAGAGALILALGVAIAAEAAPVQEAGALRAGAAAVDINPRAFPVRIVGGFLERKATRIVEPLFARALVLNDGTTSVAIVVVDSCLIPRGILDRAKELASATTGIPIDHMLISATHTHSAPAVVGALGTDVDENYTPLLSGWIAEAVERAAANLAPARIGWTVVGDPEHVHCRRWIRRPDRIDLDPFGHRTVRAMMHPGYQNPDYLGPSGPSDPDLSLVSVQTAAGRPIALLANYSMHYVGAEPVSADYFGAFGGKVAGLLGISSDDPSFVGMLSNGTSGDQWYMDYSKPRHEHSVDSMADALARLAVQAMKRIEYQDRAPITMRESKLTLDIRPISDEDLARAEEAFAKVEQRQPQKFEEVYPREQVLLKAMPPTRELKLQAIRIGELGIATIPCEVYAITGLKIKAFSPLSPTFTIELANGCEGYIPPPEQHLLGGYNTWRARTACLEVQAEPKILEGVLTLLEQVAGSSRRTVTGEEYPFGGYPRAVLDSRPIAYWRLNEFSGPRASDASGNGHDAAYEGGVAYYLDGPAVGVQTAGATMESAMESAAKPADAKRINRAPQLVGGRITVPMGHAERYTLEMWFYNCMPTDARATTGILYSRTSGGTVMGDVLAIGGTQAATGRLVFMTPPLPDTRWAGQTELPPHTWHHVAVVRDGKRVAVYLDGAADPEVSAETEPPSGAAVLTLGSSPDDTSSFEGRIDEVALYDRALSANELRKHLR